MIGSMRRKREARRLRRHVAEAIRQLAALGVPVPVEIAARITAPGRPPRLEWLRQIDADARRLLLTATATTPRRERALRQRLDAEASGKAAPRPCPMVARVAWRELRPRVTPTPRQRDLERAADRMLRER